MVLQVVDDDDDDGDDGDVSFGAQDDASSSSAARQQGRWGHMCVSEMMTAWNTRMTGYEGL